MRKRGITLMELLLSLLITSLVLTVVYKGFGAIFIGLTADDNSNSTSTQVRGALDTLSDHVRNGSACTNSAAGTVDAVLHAGTATSFTYYGTSACAQVSYSLSGTNLVRTDNGTTIVARNISSLSFTYYKAATYNTAWTTTTNSHVPTTAELPYVCGILIDVSTTFGGVTSRTLTTVRLRNAPKKANLDGL